MNLRNAYRESGILQNLERGATRGRRKIIVKGIRPQDYFTLAVVCCGAGAGRRHSIFSRPALEALTREPGQTPLWANVKYASQNGSNPRRLGAEIGKPRSRRSEFRPAVHHAKRIGLKRS